MAAPSFKIDGHPIPLHSDKIVRRLDDFPELLRALRDGDLLTGRLFCDQLFDCGRRRPLASMALKVMKRINGAAPGRDRSV